MVHSPETIFLFFIICRGRVRRVSMRSLGWDMKVNLDGIYSVPLDYGVQAVMKIVDEPKYVLRTVDFSPLPGISA